MKQPTSIFNDVVGPIMTGPSSSHTAGPCRIGLIGYQLCLGIPKTIRISFDKSGSFASSYNLQGTDRGLVGGLLGVYPEDNRLHDILKEAKNKDVNVSFHITEFETDHPNTAKISLLTHNGEQIKLIGQSTGEGIFKIVDINGFSVQIMRDYYELIAMRKIGCEIKVLQLLQGVDIQVNYTSVVK
ncbi:serine dehydratase beta chain [Anaerotignum propionicum]|uniref:serine dehydratase beta chain n=1 Tax=Anaerotignum propionicum TaxID=28446 RepID=UPI0021092EF6|nr:serine dehydratase beta chain [Anaerotignum propionicum]MCQ4936037.1 L-serine ammonia-lyase, iron-sulfur-dependent, subunit beta [Anaerotignum propionicum]